MSVEAFTVDGKVTLDITPFESAISQLTSQLSELKDGLNNLGINATNFTNELSLANSEMVKIKEEVVTIDSDLTNTIESMGNLRNETGEFGNQLRVANETVSALNNATSTLVYDFGQFTTEVGQAVEQVQVLNNEFNAMRYYVDMAKAEETALLQIEQKRIDALTKLQSDESKRIQHLHNIIDYLHMEEQQMEANASIQRDIILRLEREEQKRQEIMQKTLNMAKRELSYLEQQHQAELEIYDDIVKRYEAQGRFVTGIQEELGLLAERNATEEQELIHLDNQLMLQKSINTLVAQGGAENIKSAEALLKQLDTDTNIYHILEKEIMAEKERLALLEEQDAVLKKQTADREKQLATSRKGNDLDKMGYLPRRVGSMALTMWGFNEIMDVYDKTMGHINAESQKDYFAKRMNMDSKATQDFTNQLNNMQKTYKKLDMTVVGANALETATKYKVQQESLGDLTEVMAIYGSEFVKQGRSQEDSILAINDALDGELRRLKEVGIGAEELEATGLWSGDETDKEGMLKALLQIAQERGYDKTAKDITNLSDAITTLEVKLSIDLARAFGVIEPLITDVLGNFVTMLEALEGAIAWVTPKITEFAKALGLIDKDGNGTKFGNFLEDWASWMITFGITAYGVYKIIKPLVGWLKNLRGATDDVAKTTGDIGNDVGKTMNTGGFKENFKSEWGKLGKNLGKMARVFVEFAVALAMAWALIEEAIILISTIGATYEYLKPQFNSGIEFIKEFGIWFALLGGVMLGLAYVVGKVPSETMAEVGQGAVNVATGLAIAMGLVAVAIGSLLMPLGAIITLGALANWQQGNLDKGIEVIQMFADALNQISAPVGVFLIALGVASVIFGYAPMLGVGVAIGIAVSIGLVAEAIFMLNAPLVAIASLGYMADTLGMDSIQQGANALKITGQALQVIAEAIPYLLVVDIGVFGQELMDWGSKLITGKDGLTYLSEEIIPNLSTFVQAFNSATIDPIQEDTVTNLSQVADNIPTIKNAIDKIRTSVGTGGTGGFNVMGFQIGGDTSSLKPKLDQLYKDIQDVIDFANKFGGDSSVSLDSVTAVSQMANVISQLQVKLNALITTITTASPKVQSASKMLGSAIKTGFSDGVSGFEQKVIGVLASGIREVQNRYDTWHSGGKASAEKLASGFETISDKFKSTISTEMGYALDELDDYKDDFYNKGAMLGEALSDGFKSAKGLDAHSPAKIARGIAQEMEYSMLALDRGKQLMYSGGVALGQALVNGYNSYGNLRTDVGVLASKGVSNEQLQANAKNNQLNGNLKGQNQQLTQTNINIDMSNSTVIGVQDLDNKIRQAVEKAIVSINSPNGAIGY